MEAEKSTYPFFPPSNPSHRMSNHTHSHLTWIVHPLRENWKRSALLLLCLTLFFIGIYWAFQSPLVTCLSIIFLLGSLYRYFVPFRYTLDEDGVVVTSLFYRLTKPWSAFRSFYVDNNGVLLSPYTKPSRLENFRGIYVRFGGNRAEVVGFIEGKVGEASSLDSGTIDTP
jgi:hypothetical protein